MGETPPTREGIGEATGGWAGASLVASLYEAMSNVRCVSCFRAASSGRGTRVIAPWMSWAMYSPGAPEIPGWFPRGFAEDDKPLPSSTSKLLLRGGPATPFGSQPVGIYPFTTLVPLFRMSTTATVLLSALATNSVC